MSFIKREKDKLNEMIRTSELGTTQYLAAHAAQQALAWALEPQGYASPTKALLRAMGKDGGTEGTGIGPVTEIQSEGVPAN